MEQLLIPADNTCLTGIFHPACQISTKTLIISHGFRGSKEGGGRAVTLAETISAAGINVLRFDFTPLKNISCQIAELMAVISYTRQTIGNEIFLMGRSLGGSTSLAVAARDKSIRGLILWATPWNLVETFKAALGQHYEQLAAGNTLQLVDEYGELTLTPDFIEDFAQHNLLFDLGLLEDLPLLILHGTADNIVPVSQAHTMYKLAADPKQLILYQGGDHHLTGHAAEATTAIAAWLGNTIRRTRK